MALRALHHTFSNNLCRRLFFFFIAAIKKGHMCSYESNYGKKRGILQK